MNGWTHAWQEVVDAIGRDFSDGATRYGPDPLERSTIRRYLETLEFDCALHYDPDVARAHGYADLTAPYTAALCWSIPAMWQPGDEPLFSDDSRDAQPARSPINNQNFPLGPRTTGYFATDMDFEFVRPVIVGERVGRRGHRLLSCVPKETAVGRGAFMVWASELVDDHGGVVMRMRTGTYAYDPHRGQPRRRERPERNGPITTGPGVTIKTQRRLEDVHVGDEIGALSFPLTVYRMVMVAGANRDFNSIHHNTEYAKATGTKEMYANMSFLIGMWERAIRDWIGPAGTIKAIRGFRMKSFNYVGDTTTVFGRVTSIRSDNDVPSITLEVWSENATGITVGPGTVEVTLPSRSEHLPAR